MTTEVNKAIVRKWIEAWMSKDLAALDQLFAQTYTVNDAFVGCEGVKHAVQFLHSVLSNISVELNDLIGEGDKVVMRWTVYGVHTGELMGVSATGRPVKLMGINIYQIAEGKIMANHEQTNVPAVIQSLKTEA